ncbi:DMT family transporter [Jannaschia seohaensis]|uniref:Drug/metabolite transporter (DMT)-like permease n=1 Tax=Jannaschia seohaensis TaxID=475081 RepID=A0A2Y9AUP7_9RHOB|nr:DMT family transporter [Jannaschia seohaensis]PWJ16910.1 drug/metabolite transporter (DMT)-like permease [Jannaschia seohaensis]SSA48114.1 Permease of the drug/metabolite transporter (DMT) superfamily [Jannaschia seohaensis]
MSETPRPLIGILWMVVTGLCFIAVTATVKHAAQELPAAQAAFLRYLLGLVFLIPAMGAIRAARIDRRDLAIFGIRGLCHTLAVILWFYAMTQISIAEVTAMNYLTPVYVTLGAALLLGERLAARRITAVLAALLGVVVILRPGFREVETGHFAMMGTALLFGVSYLSAKPLSGRHSAALVVAVLSITVTIGLAPFAYAVWVPPSMTEVAWMFLVASFATAGHYSMTRAFAAAPIAVTQPVTFLQMVWAVLLGWALFDEAPDGWVILGATIIIASVSFIAWREARLRREVVRPQVVIK